MKHTLDINIKRSSGNGYILRVSGQEMGDGYLYRAQLKTTHYEVKTKRAMLRLLEKLTKNV